MSVIIEGMEMPQDCFSCPLREEGFCNLTNNYATDIYKRDSDCPLVELPEHHGRLIDVDKFKSDYGMGDDCNECGSNWKRCQYDYIYNKMDFCSWINDQPIVIETEGDN